MSKAIIIYTSKTGNTKSIAEFVAEGIRFAGAQASIKEVSQVADPSELEACDIIVLGSATYNSNMMEEMKEFIEVAKSVNLEGKKGGAFGAYGWSGEAPEQIYNAMKNDMKIVMAGDCLRLKSADLGGGMKMAQDYGREIAALAES